MTGRDGGYYYGHKLKPKEFTLECYFEEIDRTTYERMCQWIHPGQQGKLIFDERPFVYYDAIVAKVPTYKIYMTGDRFSGTISLFFKAEDPRGRMTYISYDTMDYDAAEQSTGIIENTMMPPAPTKTSRDFLLYNPGTVPCDLTIRIGGTAAKGLTITNMINGNECVLTSLPSGSDYIEIDGHCGLVRKLPSEPDKSAFAYHDLGYITLEPSTPYDRGVVAHYSSGSNEVTFDFFEVDSSYVDRYIYLGGSWLRIMSVTATGSAIVEKRFQTTGSEQTMITNMNHITITGDNITLNRLEFEYTPYVL